MSEANQVLTVVVSCRGNPECRYWGEDMFVDIDITNTGRVDVEFPLAFARKSGPYVTLINTRTGVETYLRRNLADPDLMTDFVRIRPGDSVSMEWVITSAELEEFGGRSVDLSAEFRVAADVKIGGKPVAFENRDRVHIVGSRSPGS